MPSKPTLFRHRLGVVWFFVLLPFRLLRHSRDIAAEIHGPDRDMEGTNA